MSTIALRLPNTLNEDLNICAQAANLSRSEYIKLAIKFMNKDFKRREMQKRLKNASIRVRTESMLINTEFDAVENDSKI